MDDNESLILDISSESDDESEIVFDDNTEDDKIDYKADNYCISNQKQASYYEQQYNQRGQIKLLIATDLRKIFNAILSNYDTCTNQMKLVVNSIALSLNEITQTDGQSSGIFRHISRNHVSKEYAMEQMLNIMR